MWIKGKWYTESEITAHIDELERKVEELDDKHRGECRQISEYDIEVKELRKLLTCIRSYYRDTMSWVDLFEEQAASLLGKDINVPTSSTKERGDANAT